MAWLTQLAHLVHLAHLAHRAKVERQMNQMNQMSELSQPCHARSPVFLAVNCGVATASNVETETIRK